MKESGSVALGVESEEKTKSWNADARVSGELVTTTILQEGSIVLSSLETSQ